MPSLNHIPHRSLAVRTFFVEGYTIAADTDRSATSLANSGWLLPVSNLIELVAINESERVMNQRGYWTTKSLSSEHFILLFLTFDCAKQSWGYGGVRFVEDFGKIMIDRPSVRVEKLICIGRASLARCSAAKNKNGHILRIQIFCFPRYICCTEYSEWKEIHM